MAPFRHADRRCECPKSGADKNRGPYVEIFPLHPSGRERMLAGAMRARLAPFPPDQHRTRKSRATGNDATACRPLDTSSPCRCRTHRPSGLCCELNRFALFLKPYSYEPNFFVEDGTALVVPFDALRCLSCRTAKSQSLTMTGYEACLVSDLTRW